MMEVNQGSSPFQTPRKQVGKEPEEILLFKYINAHGINPPHGFVELANIMGILECMESGFYNVVEMQ